MGNAKNKQLIFLVVILLVTSLLIYRNKDHLVAGKSIPLTEVLQLVEGYDALETVPAADWLVELLELDDTTQIKYEKNGTVLDLYVGYYFSIEKLSAAHSPLVCMPGQGWQLNKLVEKTALLSNHELNYAEVVAGHGEEQMLVMYWFQAYDKTSPNMSLNIYNALFNVFERKPSEHSFIRVLVPIKNMDKERAHSIGMEFITAFYPVFLSYVKDTRKF